MQWVEDGETKELKGFDHPDRARILAVIPNPTAHVKPKLKQEKGDAYVVAEFWRRVAAHYGVTVSRAKARVQVLGAPQAVQDIWTKAEALMTAGVSHTDIKDEANWS
jgi:hypothetical protein